MLCEKREERGCATYTERRRERRALFSTGSCSPCDSGRATENELDVDTALFLLLLPLTAAFAGIIVAALRLR